MYSDPPVGQWFASPTSDDWPRQALAKPYAFRMLGRFIGRGGDESVQLDTNKAHQTLGYLLVHHDRPHRREALAGKLWQTYSSAQGRKHLRHSLWLIESRLFGDGRKEGRLLIKERDWVQINADAIWLDVLETEKVFNVVRGIPGERMSRGQAAAVKSVVTLYRGDLLEGWIDEWCVYDRERIRIMHLAMLEKLLGYCEARGECEEGLVFGEWLLRHDRAHERAHRRMMRLNYKSGDRTGALRQYERCCAALLHELGVGPSDVTRHLYEQMRLGAPAELIGALRS